MASPSRVQPAVLQTSTTPNSQHNHIQNLNLNQPLPPQQHQTPVIDTNNHNHTNYNINNINGINSKKRSLEQDFAVENTPCYKMRAILKEIRPMLLEVLSHPDFKTCQAGRLVQEKVKLMVDLCHQQTASLINCNSVAGSQGSASLRQVEPKHSLAHRDINSAAGVMQEKRLHVGNTSEKQTAENHKRHGSYIVGGSAFGWNFLMFQGTKPEYYGRSKESFRAGL